MAARAVTSPELAQLRRNGQWSKVFVAFPPYATVYSARVNQTFATADRVTQITYDAGSGTLADVKVGMTLWVGSSAGASDLGFCRVRKTPSSTVLYISEESKIAWADNLYLTVVRDFQLLQKHIVVTDSTTYMDVDVAYSDQHSACNPTPMLGPLVQVLKKTNVSVTTTRSGSGSYCIGSSISAHAWNCDTAVTITNANTATPSFEFSAVGWHLIWDTVTAANVKTKTGYRWIFVYDDFSMPATCVIEPPTGDADSGAWSCGVRMTDDIDLTTVRDRSLCVLFTEDVYGTERVSLGPVSGFENVLLWGWIAQETIVLPPTGRGGEVSFMLEGPQQWLARIPAFPVGVEDVQTTPAAWTEFEDLTVRAGVWHMLEWRTTATTILDIQLTSDTRGLPDFKGASGHLWEQLVQNCAPTIYAFPRCDRYGKLYIEIDPQYVFEANRSSFPNVMDLTRPDWSEQIQQERNTIPRAGQVDWSGISFVNGAAQSLFSLSPGHVPNTYGEWMVSDRFLAYPAQADTNTLAGLVAGRENNSYPSTTIKLAGNNRFFDIAPAMYIRETVAASDTPRGYAYTNKRFIPRRVRLIHNPRTLAWRCELEVEAETFAAPAVTGDAPPDPPDLPLTPPLPPRRPPIFTPGLPTTATEAWFITDKEKIVYSSQVFDDAISQPTWKTVAVLPATDGFWDLGGSNVGSFAAAIDGSVVYLCGRMSGEPSTSKRWAIWKCVNPKAASPTWTNILKGGDTVLASTVKIDPGNSTPFGRMERWGTKVVIGIRLESGQAYGEYNGVGWTFYSASIGAQDIRNQAVLNRVISEAANPTTDIRSLPGSASIASFAHDQNAMYRSQIWQNLLGGNRFVVRKSGGVSYIRNISTSTDVANGFGASFNRITNTMLRGAVRGQHLLFVDDDGAGAGQIYVSTTGASFAAKTTWLPGIADIMRRDGGTSACWLVYNTPNSNEMFRTTPDVTVTTPTWSNKTGNYWTDVQPGGDAFNARDLQLVFRAQV